MSVSNIHETAFDGCVNLKIAAEAGSVAAEYDAQRDKSNVANAEYQDILPEEGVAEEGIGGEATGNPANGTNGNVLGQSAIVGGNAVIFMDNSQSKVLSGNDYPAAGNEAETGASASAEVMGGNGQNTFVKYTIVDNKKNCRTGLL